MGLRRPTSAHLVLRTDLPVTDKPLKTDELICHPNWHAVWL